MIKCPSCGKKVLGEDLLTGVCSNCQHRLSVGDSGSGDIAGTLATEMSQHVPVNPLIDSVSGGLSGFDRQSSEFREDFGSSADSGIEKTMQSDEFFGEPSPADSQDGARPRFDEKIGASRDNATEPAA